MNTNEDDCKEECPANNNGLCAYGDYIRGCCEAEKMFWNRSVNQTGVRWKNE